MRYQRVENTLIASASGQAIFNKLLVLADALEFWQPFFHERTHAFLEIFTYEGFRHPAVGLGHGFA